MDTPTHLHGKQVYLEGSDVLFTGKEIFVGIRKNGTNTEGALVSDFIRKNWNILVDFCQEELLVFCGVLVRGFDFEW